MITPAARPVITDIDRPSQFSMPRRYSMMNVATAMSAALRFVPSPSECSRSRIVAPSLVLTVNMPISDRNMPTDAIVIGAMTALSCISPFMANAVAPSAAVESIEPQ